MKSAASRFAVDVADGDGGHGDHAGGGEGTGRACRCSSTTQGSAAWRRVHDYPLTSGIGLVRVNLHGRFHGISRPRPPLMVDGGGGAIVNTASISGARPAAGEARTRRPRRASQRSPPRRRSNTGRASG
jgi:NAD(P)-dependent dehydrogenase (short-subunit alcohol dehydrogenase family)